LRITTSCSRKIGMVSSRSKHCTSTRESLSLLRSAQASRSSRRCGRGGEVVGCPCGCSRTWQCQGGCVIGSGINRQADTKAVAIAALPSPCGRAGGAANSTALAPR
jgi:hypothetical protein